MSSFSDRLDLVHFCADLELIRDCGGGFDAVVGHFAALDFAMEMFETAMKSKQAHDATDAARSAYRHAALTLIAIKDFRGAYSPGSDMIARVMRLARRALELYAAFATPAVRRSAERELNRSSVVAAAPN